MSDAMMVGELVNYVSHGTTLRDISLVVGERLVITKEEAAVVVQRCDEILETRKAIKTMGERLMVYPKAPHNGTSARDEYVYVGFSGSGSMFMKAIAVHGEAKGQRDYAIPYCLMNERGLLVYHVKRYVEEGKPARWVCKPYQGEVPLFGDIYTPLVAFKVSAA